MKVIFIPSDLAGWQFRAGQLQRGFAHASLDVLNSVQVGGLGDRGHDENAVRHVGYFALYDWCWGGDIQGLEALTQNRRFFTHDHGWFLPPEGAAWDTSSLQSFAQAPHELGIDGGGLDMIELQRISSRLDSVTHAELMDVVSAIPRSWPVTDTELEAVGAFLEHRAKPVASRLRTRFGGNP